MQMLAGTASKTGAQTASGNLLSNDSTHRMVQNNANKDIARKLKLQAISIACELKVLHTRCSMLASQKH